MSFAQIIKHIKTPGHWAGGLAVRSGSLCFLGFFLGGADQVANGAARLAGRLAGSLTFTAAFELDGVLQRRLIDSNDVFGHNVTSLKNMIYAEIIIP